MINTSTVVKSLQTLAEEIRDSDPGGYDRLNLLSSAVQNNAHADAWAYADVHAMIAPDSIVERYRNNKRTNGTDRLVAVLETIRNTCIFLPIIITWYVISQATTKYGEFVSQAINARKSDIYAQPFLYLWQQRFYDPGFPAAYTLSSVAFADVFILAIILLLTFFAYTLSATNTARKDEDARRLRANLNHAITGAVLSLHARPQLTSGDNLELVARNLDNTVRQIVDQVRDMSQQCIGRLDKLAQETTTRFDGVACNITQQFDRTIQQAHKQLSEISQEMNQQVQAGKGYLTELGTLTSGVVKTSTEIQAAAQTLKVTNDSLINSINRLVKPAEAMAGQQAQLLDSVQKSVGLLQGNAKAIGDLVSQQRKVGDDLADTLDTFTLAVEKFTTLGKEQSNLVQQHGAFLQHLQDEHDKQTQLAVLLSDATVGVKNALSEMNNGAISLRSMAVSMHEMMGMQAAMVSNPGMAVAVDLSHITHSYETVAQLMENSGNTLKGSAIAIQRASQQLRDVLDTVQTSQGGH